MQTKTELNKISVIIPVYKVEQYINQCLESIVNQTYKNLEIILIDDGSPDNCGAICDEYAKKDDRIVVIHKQNEGLAAAVKTGLLNATCDRVVFVDSDDWVELDYVQSLVYMSHDADLGICGRIPYDKGGARDYSSTIQDGTYDLDDETRVHFIKEAICYGMKVSRWAKIFDRELAVESIKKCDLRVVVGEDLQFLIMYLLKCKKIIHNDKIRKYHYRFNPQSILRSYKPSFCEKNMILLDRVLEECIKEGYTELEDFINRERITWLTRACVNEAKNPDKKHSKEELKKIIAFYSHYNLKKVKPNSLKIIRPIDKKVRAVNRVLKTRNIFLIKLFLFAVRLFRLK